ncbi:hypothetical protein CAAU_0837 [Caloramator australicus RC3]|uniref:Uncharacterized protein n=1 Tax=Caloramator australicus RC3 TaxID=857293 RepID=I7J4R4_9CLOT|nr:hypothetical protein CAAU_0837 [Caloramator australicus RC3]
MFQSLIGRLRTSYNAENTPKLKKFQSLIGRLRTSICFVFV